MDAPKPRPHTRGLEFRVVDHGSPFMKQVFLHEAQVLIDALDRR